MEWAANHSRGLYTSHGHDGAVHVTDTMPEFYDRYEHRARGSRETALIRELRGILSVGKARTPTLRGQLKGVIIDELKSRGDLAQIPVLRKTDLRALQKDAPPFGGACPTRPGALQRILISAGDVAFHPEGQAKDWWGAARAMFAAGIRRGDLVLSCFSDQSIVDACMIDAGARALGCAVVPITPAYIESVTEAVAQLKATAFCGEAKHLKTFIEANARNGKRRILRRALLLGRGLAPALRNEIASYGVDVFEAYALADLGIVAFESEAHDGLIVNEGLIVEVVRPGGNDPVPVGEIGEMVVTRLNADFPLLRFGTEELSAVLAGMSSCGRTNMRIAGFIGQALPSAQFDGKLVETSDVAAIGRLHPGLGRVRLVITSTETGDSLTLRVEAKSDASLTQHDLLQKLQKTVPWPAKIEIVKPGGLPGDGKIISDERAANGPRLA